MINLTERETKVAKIALGLLLTRLKNCGLEGEEELFGEVIEALGEQVMMEEDVTQAVLNISEKLGDPGASDD